MGKGNRLRLDRATNGRAPKAAKAPTLDVHPDELLPPTFDRAAFGDLHPVQAECPVTKKFVKTGFSTTPEAFETAVLAANSFGCSACGRTHTWEEAGAVLGN